MIEKKSKGYKQELTVILAEEYLLTYPDLFIIKRIDDKQLAHVRALKKEDQRKTIKQWINQGHVELKLSGQADIYAYIFLHTATLLVENGSLAIITSNSWLDVSYGSVLKQFFFDHFKVKMIIASWAEPWFDDAAVNTIVTVLERDNKTETRNSNIVRFVKLKKKLEELIPYRDLRVESGKRWERIDGLVSMIESAEHQKNVRHVSGSITSFETEEMRIRMVKQSDLLNELQGKDDLAKWGKYLRAPDVYFEILEKCKGKLVPLKQIADVRRGYTTGINEFFYLKLLTEPVENRSVICSNDRGWEGEIESVYLKKIIKSPKESESIIIDPSKLKYFIFICNKSKAELKKLGHSGALKYIEWGEKQRTEDDMPWIDVPSVSGRKYWWSIEVKDYSDMIWPKAFNDRYPIASHDGYLVADRLYELTLHNKNDKDIIVSLLNSSLQYLFIETNSRINLGEGALDNMTYEAELCEIIDPEKVSTIKLPLKLMSRKIAPIFDEVKQKDRKTLDATVLKALGLDVEEYLPRIYEGLCEMVRERLELPKMRKKQQKAKVKISYDQVKASVIADCLPDGVRRFPEDFYDDVYEKLEWELHPTSGLPLTSEQFMGHYDIKDSEGKVILLTDSEPKAEFALLLAKQNILQLKIPKKEKIVEAILKNYIQYIKGIRKSLEEDAHKKLHDWSIAERMAREILEEYGLA